MLTNDEIILLDNLMYLGKGVPDIASEDIDDTTILGADSYKDQTIGEWLNEIDFSFIPVKMQLT